MKDNKKLLKDRIKADDKQAKNPQLRDEMSEIEALLVKIKKNEKEIYFDWT
ncbi:MAG: hypothetical protein HRT89_15670 [Lentisphaeria bacterium]|nr:hypothetical protein [Lentisphaeria bacterium]NQZ69496.1 hypothetical protein [Lentisphaeria bacterium]